MSATFWNMRRRKAAKAKELAATVPVKEKVEAEKPKKGKVKKDV